MTTLAQTAPPRPSAVQEATAYWGKARLTLKKGELAKYARMGGMRGQEEEVVIRENGDVIQTVRRFGQPATKRGWHLAPKEMRTIRAQIAGTPFAKFRSGPRTDHTASAVDGVDFLYVARQGRKVEWFSTGHWRLPEGKQVKFFETMNNLAPVAGG